MVWFTLKVLDGIHAQDITDGIANLRLSIVAEQRLWCTILPDEILKGARDIPFTSHRVDSSDKALTSTKELHHCRAAMTKEPNVHGRGFRKVGISSNNLI
jgi:hypothetical protein